MTAKCGRRGKRPRLPGTSSLACPQAKQPTDTVRTNSPFIGCMYVCSEAMVALLELLTFKLVSLVYTSMSHTHAPFSSCTLPFALELCVWPLAHCMSGSLSYNVPLTLPIWAIIGTMKHIGEQDNTCVWCCCVCTYVSPCTTSSAMCRVTGNRYDPEPRTRRVYKDNYSERSHEEGGEEEEARSREYHDDQSRSSTVRVYRDEQESKEEVYRDEPEEKKDVQWR